MARSKLKKCPAVLLLFLGGLISFSFQVKAEGFSIVENERSPQIDVLYNGQLITSYLYSNTLDKPVLFPLITPDGVEVTRGYPLAPRQNERTDHPHHVGVWFNFGDVNGLDFWNNSSAIPPERKMHYGSVRHKAIRFVGSGVDRAEIEAESEWINLKEEVLLKENARYVFRKEGSFLTIERVTILTAWGDTVTLKDNKEGLFAIRVAREFEAATDKPDFFIGKDGKQSQAKIVNQGNANGVYRNSEGAMGDDVWGKQASWVVLSAKKDGLPVSIAIIDHPDNPGYPACSHARGYGLFSINNLGRNAFNKELDPIQCTLKKGDSICIKHKLALKSGGFASDEELNALFYHFE
ncbi:DUF6807 domain-containing protein [Massilibacteroides vaginae]|uniref:DUF6807 domain-containing protein n=1 Tax=Massilibacteroides vaginae TaxID=1673718 RepID=UPI0015939C5D|nr:PmoA family protein [Massilibacteroides vaginae]